VSYIIIGVLRPVWHDSFTANTFLLSQIGFQL